MNRNKCDCVVCVEDRRAGRYLIVSCLFMSAALVLFVVAVFAGWV